MGATLPERDQPWVMRTYSGHSSARASNSLYRQNLARGQTGLSIAFDLPTQCGYDPDDPRAAGEVGKVGVPVAHLGHMRQLLSGIDPAVMNTSMTINATAAWLLGLYVANAEEQGADFRRMAGTTQNDIVKEYLSRGTYIFPPEASRRLIVDTVAWTLYHTPRWNPVNVCSYHLQEAGATPVQELAYALATAIGVLDAVRDSGQVVEEEMGAVVGRISFFVNAGIRFVEEVCKMRAFGRLWDTITRERYRVQDPKHRRFRYGVQVNSLGLTEQQPENNVPRIVLESLGVLLSRDARARALQLPAWNEALGLPRPWDQQWSLRIQQVLANETDLLEYADIFDGSTVIEARTAELAEAAQAELSDVLAHGGAFSALDTMKARLVAAQAERTRRIESGDLVVVGVNRHVETATSPLGAGTASILVVDPDVERELVADVQAWRAERDAAAVEAAIDDLRRVCATAENIMPVTIALAHAGGTTGEWAEVLRGEFGEYRAPTGVGGARAAPQSGQHGARAAQQSGQHGARAAQQSGEPAARAAQQSGEPAARAAQQSGEHGAPRHRSGGLEATAERVKAWEAGPPRILVAKPGLDGHSNGAEQIAVAARDAGFEVVYQGIRLTPAEIAAAARDEDPDVVGLSILSGSHLALVPEVVRLMRAAGVDAPVVVGGIIPEEDRVTLLAGGVARVYTPKDYELSRIMADLADLVEATRQA